MPKKLNGYATLYIRIPDHTYDKIAVIAKEGHRPIAAQIGMVLEAWLKRRGGQ